MASRTSSSFMVYIYQCEIEEIRKQFEQHRRKESDGDLFGLWTNSGHAVVHLVSGITKTSSSAVSSQERDNDLKILLEEKYMLCHIGKWRFNPSVTSGEPSTSDEAAVERFYSRGDGQKACILLKFSEGKADIQAYLFVGGYRQVSADLSILSGSQFSNVTENPLRNVPAIREKLQSETPLSTGQSRNNNGSDSWVTFRNDSGELSKSPSAQTPSSKSSSSQITSIPPPSQPCLVSLTTQNSTPLQGIQTVNNSSAQSPSSPTASNPAPKLNDDGEKILKQVQEKATSMVKDLKTVVSHCEPSTGDVELKLEVNQIKCTVRFPVTFPETPAKVVCRLPEQLYIFEVTHPNEKFDSVDSILSAVKDWFDCHIGLSSLSSAIAVTTAPAPQVKGDSLCSEAPLDKSDNVDEVQKFAEEVRDKIKKTFKITNGVELKRKTEKSEKKVELRFEHHYRNNKKWLIVLPTKFREQPTQIYHVNLVGLETRVGREVCERSDQIIAAIKKSCICGSCFHSRRL